jgi:hypothetical protein
LSLPSARGAYGHSHESSNVVDMNVAPIRATDMFTSLQRTRWYKTYLLENIVLHTFSRDHKNTVLDGLLLYPITAIRLTTQHR